jgi:VCBS repeat-containing protein
VDQQTEQSLSMTERMCTHQIQTNFGTDVNHYPFVDPGTPGVSSTNQTLTITVTAVNDAPIADNDTNTTTEDNPTVEEFN